MSETDERDPDEPLPATPHDGLFRFTFTQPEHAAGLLRAALPSEALAHFDLESLELVPGSFIDPELRELESDLLYRVKLAGDDAFVLVLVEHQSRTDPMMAFRLAKYMMRALERWVREHPKAERLPAMVSLVVAHAERPWNAPTSLIELVNLAEPIRTALAPYLLNARYLLDDLTAQSSEALRDRQATAFAKLVLFLLKRGRVAADLLDELRAWLAAARSGGTVALGPEELLPVVVYTRVVAEIDPARLRAFLVEDLHHPNPDEVMTPAEKLLRMIGPPKWLAEGRAEGRSQGRAELLLKLLARRFGPVPAEVENRLHQASIEELDTMGERVLDATTLAEVLGEAAEP